VISRNGRGESLQEKKTTSMQKRIQRVRGLQALNLKGGDSVPGKKKGEFTRCKGETPAVVETRNKD